MNANKNDVRGFRWTKQSRRAILAAVGGIGLAASYHASAQPASTLFFDNNGTAASFGSGTGTWNNLATNKDWATTTAGTTVGTEPLATSQLSNPRSSLRSLTSSHSVAWSSTVAATAARRQT